jgi:hypothetical protein
MAPAAMVLMQELDGWSIRLTTGEELARFRWLAARWRAERYLAALLPR